MLAEALSFMKLSFYFVLLVCSWCPFATKVKTNVMFLEIQKEHQCFGLDIYNVLERVCVYIIQYTMKIVERITKKLRTAKGHEHLEGSDTRCYRGMQ